MLGLSAAALRNASLASVMFFSVGAAFGPCAKMRGAKGDPSASSSATLSAASASAAAAAAAASASAAAAAASAAASAARAAQNAAALDKAKASLADIQWMIAHNATSNPAKGGEGDLQSKCDEVESKRTPPSGGREPDPETKKTLDEASALCAFDAPLVVAGEALDHLKGSPQSQASKLLMCNIAVKECDRARTAKPKDPKLRRMDARRIEACGR